MPTATPAQPREARLVDAQELAAAIGVRIVAAMPVGESGGAYEVTTADGERAVLKIESGLVPDFAVAHALTRGLRARGCPIPARLDHGAIGGFRYELLELLPGKSLETVTPGLLPDVMRVHELLYDLDMPGRAPWLDDMVTSVTEGRSGYCEHAALRAHDRDLLDRLRSIAGAAAHADTPTTDAVHFDFSPLNILADDDRVTGVVDWNGATSGDASFDLVTLAFYTHDADVHATMLERAGARTDPRALQLYAAHMVLRQLDWSLRFHPDQLLWFTGLGLALLAEVGAG
jgi:Ser/Thr protein kinase RdoA (MazF antagonist)